jgi:hypothetical protein
MPFPGLWGDILQNYDDQKTTLWHIRGPGQCFCSTAWAWGPPFGPLGLGAPGFARSEPTVVTPLSLALDKQRTSLDNDDALLSSLLFTFETLTPSPSREYKEVSQCRKSRLIIVFEFRFSIIITRMNCMLPLYVLGCFPQRQVWSKKLFYIFTRKYTLTSVEVWFSCKQLDTKKVVKILSWVKIATIDWALRGCTQKSRSGSFVLIMALILYWF